MIATYGEDGTVDVMNMAWGGICAVGRLLELHCLALQGHRVLFHDGGVYPATKLNAFVFDQFQSGYYAIGEKVGQAWKSGMGGEPRL